MVSRQHSAHDCRSPAKSASKEIQALIQEGSEDVERFGQLVDVLLDSELPFKESSLGGGEWQVYLDRRQITVYVQCMSTVYLQAVSVWGALWGDGGQGNRGAGWGGREGRVKKGKRERGVPWVQLLSCFTSSVLCSVIQSKVQSTCKS